MQSRKSLQQLWTKSRDSASIQYRATIGPILYVYQGRQLRLMPLAPL